MSNLKEKIFEGLKTKGFRVEKMDNFHFSNEDYKITFPAITSYITIRMIVSAEIENVSFITLFIEPAMSYSSVKLIHNDTEPVDNLISKISNHLNILKDQMYKYITLINDIGCEMSGMIHLDTLCNTTTMIFYIKSNNGGLAYIKPKFNFTDSFVTFEVGNGVVPPMIYYSSISYEDLIESISLLI